MRIAIIGPECTGKTTLAGLLAEQFDGIATEEYARIYFQQRQLPADHILTTEEMCEVMQGQQALEMEAWHKKSHVFIDAGTVHGPLYAGLIEDANGALAFDLLSVDKAVLDYGKSGYYDGFLVCVPHPELEWQDDGCRGMPHFEDRLRFAHGCMAFVAQHYAHAPQIAIDATTWKEREKQAIEAVTEMVEL